MKIGIISMQRVANYGSFLQAFGLKSLVEGLGHEVVFLDYKEEAPVVPYSRSAWLKYKAFNLPLIKFANDWMKFRIFGKKAFGYRYRLEYLKALNIGYRKNTGAKVDVAVVGSDEVFNCLQAGFNVGFSPMLFGQRVRADKVISYAASFGYTDLEGLRRYQIDKTVAGYLASFDAVSVRDNNSQEIVKSLTGITPEINLDPVLIADFSIPSITIPWQNYVVLYTYKSRAYTEEDRRAILNFCRQNGKTLISIGNAQSWIKNRVEASPFELLAYLRHADLIITDTFHGSVFSIKYNKKFATLIRDDNKQKLSDLLQRLKREDRIISSFSELQEIYEKSMDYAETNAVIESEKKHTMEYLRNNLS